MDVSMGKTDPAEESGGGGRPTGGIEGFVGDADNIGIVEFPPQDPATVEIAEAVGAEVGDLQFELVVAGFEDIGRNVDAIRMHDEGTQRTVVDFYPNHIPDFTQVQDDRLADGSGEVERGSINRRT